MRFNLKSGCYTQYFFIYPYLTKLFEARRIEASEQIPHGIKYSLTLHDVNNTRVIGFDNAHSVKTAGKRRKKYSGRIVTWDHIHKCEKATNYEFESASRLMSDFWEAVDELIRQ